MKAKLKRLAKSVVQKGITETADYYINRNRRSRDRLDVIRKYHLYPGKYQQEEVELSYQPLISVITPLYNTKESYLRELIDSVRNQTYQNWELCLADGSDADHAYIEDICDEYGDDRIRYHRLDSNEGIVGNTNWCISFASGQYYGLLDHDDVLHPMALYECVKAINQGADFVYTDEMKFSGQIEDSVDIVCKNDFSKYELRSHNYICHFVVFKAQLLDDLEELYRTKCEGSQDYDMVLRLTEKAEKIVHIPKILYYWRVHEGSVAMDLSVKQYAVDAAKIAISDHLMRCGDKGSVECNYPYETIYRLTYDMETFPTVSIIWNGNISVRWQRKYLDQMIKCTEYPSMEIICRGQEERNLSARNMKLKVMKEQNLHRYVWADQMSEKAGGEILVFMDCTCIPQSREWLKELVMYAVKNDVGAVGPFVTDRLKRTVSAGSMLDSESESGIVNLNQGMDIAEQGYEANMKHVRGVASLPGFCMMVSKKKYENAGGFDASMGDYADADLCLRLKEAGMENIWTPFSVVLSAKKVKYWEEENLTFVDKWICKKADASDRSGYWCHPLLKSLHDI